MSGIVQTNNNAAVIESLKQTIEYLEQHPGIPLLTINWLYAGLHDKQAFRDAARAMGSFEKKPDDTRYKLIHKCGTVSIEVSIPRGTICKKIVTWDCPEDPLLEDTVEGD